MADIENISNEDEQVKRPNASINQDYSKDFVRITIKIPRMRTALNWRKLKREPTNGLITKATYHGTRVYFEFILHQGTLNEIKYEYAPNEPFHGPIEYNRSYFKYKNEYVLWFIHKAQSW